MKHILLALGFVLLLSFGTAKAGTDLKGYVQYTGTDQHGNFWLKLDNADFNSFCGTPWMGMNLYVPHTHPGYKSLVAMVAIAQTMHRIIRVSNMEAIRSSTGCNITASGYMPVLYTN